MNVIIDHKKKLYTVWFLSNEKPDKQLMEIIREDASVFQKAGYLVAYMHSGSEDLTETTSALICSNFRESNEKQRALGTITEV